MSPARLQEIQDLYLDALALPADEREALLAERCAKDPDLRAEVASLLAADPGASFLEEPLAHIKDASDLAESQTFSAEQQLGTYKLIKELGHGGMGTVYLAERADGQFDHEVALKVTRPGLASSTLKQRFLQERQILARLQHPHIARLLDGGITDSGRPFFAMEYVQGTPLTLYADEQRLPLNERLRLFMQVGEAVQYAHRNLVVHRDLKPSNILVTPAGRVKLLDFGIAKVLEDESAQNLQVVPLTQTDMRVMTPEYAAPEQIKGEAVTTTTDVYALGVLLYELLTGHRPYQVDRPTPGAMERAILEQEPLRPSTAIRRTTERARKDGSKETITPEQISAARQLRPLMLQRRLEGELDLIILKALRKEPEQRYASAEAFMEDIRRYLSGLPIAARRGSAGYRVRKFVQRHRLGVIASILVVFSLLGGLSVATWQARVAAHERNLAREEAEKAAQVSSFLIDLFDVSNPFSTSPVRGDTLTARTILARGASRIEHELAQQPLVQAEMRNTIGHVYRNLALLDEADSLMSAALEQRRQLLGSHHPSVATSLSDLGQLRQNQGDYPAAESLQRAALDMQMPLLGPNHPDVANTQYHLGVAMSWQGTNLEEAESLLRQALATQTEYYGSNHATVAYTLNSLGNLLTDQERHDEAADVHAQTLAIRRALLEPTHPSIAISLNNLAFTRRNQARYSEAEPLYREALEILRAQLGEAHLYVAVGLNNLADVLAKQEKHAEAVPFFSDALPIFAALDQEGHALEAVIKSNLAASLTVLEQYAKAELLLLAAEQRLDETFGPDHAFSQRAHERLAALYTAWGQPEKAAPWE